MDRVYRYGGEEFLVLLPEQTLPQAAIALRRVRGRVEDLALEHCDGGPERVVTLSIGVASFTAPRRVTSQQLIAEADEALYEAKNAGRNRVLPATS